MVPRHLSHSLKLGISPRIIKKGIYVTRKTVTSLIACNWGIRTNSRWLLGNWQLFHLFRFPLIGYQRINSVTCTFGTIFHKFPIRTWHLRLSRSNHVSMNPPFSGKPRSVTTWFLQLATCSGAFRSLGFLWQFISAWSFYITLIQSIRPASVPKAPLFLPLSLVN